VPEMKWTVILSSLSVLICGGIITITSFNAGTYTSISDDGASGTITVSVNSGLFVAFVNPLVLVATDTVQFKRTLITASGYVEMLGTYV